MNELEHVGRTTGRALLNWGRAVVLDALIVGCLWLVGLELLHVPWAPLWVVIGGLMQFVPAFGGMIAVIGPAIATTFADGDDTLFRLCMVLGLYGAIVVLEGLVIGPYILHRATMVPWWAAFLGPILLGILIPPWGVLIAPPLLAVIFRLEERRKAKGALRGRRPLRGSSWASRCSEEGLCRPTAGPRSFKRRMNARPARSGPLLSYLAGNVFQKGGRVDAIPGDLW